MKNENVRKALAYIPEVLLLIGGVFYLLADLIYGSPTPFISGLIIFGMVAIIALLLWRNKYFALSISVVLGCISVFFMLAVVSEFGEFPVGDWEGIQMLLIGTLIFGGLLTVSLLMPGKYFSLK